MDPFTPDPRISVCSCGCLERGRPCRNGRRILVDRQRYDQLQALQIDAAFPWLPVTLPAEPTSPPRAT